MSNGSRHVLIQSIVYTYIQTAIQFRCSIRHWFSFIPSFVFFFSSSLNPHVSPVSGGNASLSWFANFHSRWKKQKKKSPTNNQRRRLTLVKRELTAIQHGLVSLSAVFILTSVAFHPWLPISKLSPCYIWLVLDKLLYCAICDVSTEHRWAALKLTG